MDKLLLLLLFLTTSNLLTAQPVKLQKNDFKVVQVSSRKSFGLGISDQQLIKLLGKPTQNRPYYFETIAQHGKEVWYHNNRFYLIGKRLIGFELKSAEFAISFAAYHKLYAVGSPLNALTKIDFKTNGAGFYPVFQPSGSPIDEFLLFSHDQTNEITKIIYGDAD